MKQNSLSHHSSKPSPMYRKQFAWNYLLLPRNDRQFSLYSELVFLHLLSVFVTWKKKTSFTNSNLLGQLSRNIKSLIWIYIKFCFYIWRSQSFFSVYAKIFHRTAVLNKLICCGTYLRTCYLCDVQLQSFIKKLPAGNWQKRCTSTINYKFSLKLLQTTCLKQLVLCQQVCALCFN